MKKNENIESNHSLLMTVDGFDDCIIGVGKRCGHHDSMTYDAQKMMRKLVKQGMDKEEAHEFFDFNILGAWVGDTTPIFIFT
jgi:hypothetical protein